MKLRNLLFGTMIACAFASCSNEDDPIVNVGQGEEAEGPATLSVQVESLATKATTDKTISNLYVLVFKGTEGTGIANPAIEAISNDLTNAGNGKVVKMPITSGNKKVLVLANVNREDLVNNVHNYGDVAGLDKSFDGEKDGMLSMNSQVYDVTLRVSKENCLGFAPTAGDDTQAQVVAPAGVDVINAVKLYRNVAKITLNAITNSPAPGYKNGRLAVDAVFLVHGKTMTKLVGNGGKAWGATESDATSYYFGQLTGNEDYAAWVARMAGKTPVFKFLTDGYTNTAYASYASTSPIEFNANGYADITDPAVFYAYENTGIVDGSMPTKKGYTLLVVKGTYTYTDVAGVSHEDKNRYYPVAVGVTGFTGEVTLPAGRGTDFDYANSGRDIKLGVLRNLWYQISMTVKGPGYDTPFGPIPDGGTDPDDPDKPVVGDTFLSVTCDVVDFGAVSQNGGEIE